MFSASAPYAVTLIRSPSWAIAQVAASTAAEDPGVLIRARAWCDRLVIGVAINRDKGPLFVIYPFDTRPELRNAVYFSRCAWQLKAIDIS